MHPAPDQAHTFYQQTKRNAHHLQQMKSGWWGEGGVFDQMT